VGSSRRGTHGETGNSFGYYYGTESCKCSQGEKRVLHLEGERSGMSKWRREELQGSNLQTAASDFLLT